MKTTLTLIFILALATAGFTTPGSAWLETGPGGRASALAGAITASVEGATANYWNPAAVGFGGNSLEAMYADMWIEGGSTQYLAGSFDLGKLGLGASAHFVGIGDMDLRDSPSANRIGSFDARNLSLGGAVSYEVWQGWRAGLGAHYLSEQIYVYDARGWSVDLGLLKQGLFDGKLDVGVAARHLGSIGELREDAEELPMTVALGGRWHFGVMGEFRPSVMADVVKVSGYDPTLRVAAESQVIDYLALRAGWEFGHEGRGLTAGFGLEYSGIQFNYAFVPYWNDLGTEHRFSIGARW